MGTELPPGHPGPRAGGRTGWEAAEARFYAAAAGDRDTYSAALDVLTTLVEVLRADHRSIADLEKLTDDPAPLLAGIPAPLPLPADLLVGTACATVARQLDATATARRHDDLVAAARAAGEVWALLEGPVDLASLSAGRRVAVHVGTGRTVVASLDPWSGDDPFVLDTPSGRRTFADRAGWLAAHAAELAPGVH